MGGAAAGIAGGMMAVTMMQGLAALQYSEDMEENAKEAAEKRLKEMYREAAAIRKEENLKRSDLALEVDREFAALQNAAVDVGGMGTNSLVRLGGDIGANEGRNLARIFAEEKGRLGALLSGAQYVKQEFQQYKREARYARRQIVWQTAMNIGGIALGMGTGKYETQGKTSAYTPYSSPQTQGQSGGAYSATGTSGGTTTRGG